MEKTHPPININPLENVNLTEEDRALAAALEMDERVIAALVELIFSQKERDLPS